MSRTNESVRLRRRRMGLNLAANTVLSERVLSGDTADMLPFCLGVRGEDTGEFLPEPGGRGDPYAPQH